MNYPKRIGNWWLGDKLGSGFSGKCIFFTNQLYIHLPLFQDLSFALLTFTPAKL